MKKLGSIVFAAMFLIMFVLSGCGSTKKAVEQRELEVVMNATYFSEEMFNALWDGFQKAYPDIKLKHEVNNKMDQTLLTRIAAGDTPDIFGAYLPNMYDLIGEGKVMELSDFYDTKAHDADAKVFDTLVPGCADAVVVDGKRYAVALSPAYGGIVVNDTLFKQNNWSIPKNFNELLDVSEKIKGKGILPLSYSALDGNRLEMCILLNAFYANGGEKLLKDLDNLELGVWKSKPVVDSFNVLKILLDKGIISKNGLGLNGATSQAEFLLGKAAMVTSGYWFEMEMIDQIPSGTELSILPFPISDPNGKQMMNSWYNSINAFADTKNKEAVYDFFRYFVSQEFQAKLGNEGGLTLLSNKKAMDELKTSPNINYFTKSVINNAVNPKVSLIASAYQWWYSEQIRKPLSDAITSVVNAQMTPEAAAEFMEKKAEDTRNDSSVKKFKR